MGIFDTIVDIISCSCLFLFQIMIKLTQWVESCPNGMRCQLKKIGETYEERDIKMITVI